MTLPNRDVTTLKSFGLTFDHFGLATRTPDKAIAFLKGLGYHIGETVYDPLQKVNLIMCPSESMPPVEIISPVDQPGPLDAILADCNESIYHVCYRSRDRSASIDALKQAGNRVIQVAAPQPATLFSNRQVSFYLVKGFGLIEILED